MSANDPKDHPEDPYPPLSELGLPPDLAEQLGRKAGLGWLPPDLVEEVGRRAATEFRKFLGLAAGAKRKNYEREIVAQMVQLIERHSAQWYAHPQDHPRFNASAWARLLKDEFPEHYKHVQLEAIRKRVTPVLNLAQQPQAPHRQQDEDPPRK